MTERRHLTFANLDENGKFERPPRQFPNIWRGEEIPLSVEIYDWAYELDEIEEGTIVGEANSIPPKQHAIWEQGSITLRSKSRKK